MKKLFYQFSVAMFFGLLAIGASAQTTPSVINESTIVQSEVNPIAWVSNADYFNSILRSNLIVWDPGFEPLREAIHPQVAGESVGQTNYAQDAQTFNDYPVNDPVVYGGKMVVWRQGVQIASGCNITATNAGDANATAPTFAINLSGTRLDTFIPASIVLNGFPNGTFKERLTGGTGSGGAVTITTTGAVFTAGVGWHGATVTPNVTSVGSYTVAPRFVILTGATVDLFSCTSGTWTSGPQLGDFFDLVWTYAPTTQPMWQWLGWSTSGSGTAVGESSDLPVNDVTPGMANTQAIWLTGPMTITNGADTGEPAGQNLYPIVGPLVGALSTKKVSGTGNITMHVQRLTEAGPTTRGINCSLVITPGTSWAVSNWPTSGGSACTPNEGFSSTVGPLQISISIPAGLSVYVDNPYIGDTQSNPTQYRDGYVTAKADAGGGDRNLDGQYPLDFIDWIQPDPRGERPYGGTGNCRSNTVPFYECARSTIVTLPMHQDLCIFLNIDCYDVSPIRLTAGDAALLSDYEGAPVTNPYPTCTGGTAGAILRCQQNRSVSYNAKLQALNPSKRSYIEGGNEQWNHQDGTTWGNVQGLGANETTPYGYWTQAWTTAYMGEPGYDASTNKFVFGAQMSGNNTTFALDALFKSPGNIVTNPVLISYAPYISFQPTANGFNTAAFSNQCQTDLADAYWYTNVNTSILSIPVNAYPNQTVFYEFNGGQTGSPAAGIPSQAEETGYQNGLCGGIADLEVSLNGMKNFGNPWQSFFVAAQQQKNFTIPVPSRPSTTGTSTNGSNVLTGVVVTSDFVPGVSVSGPGFSGSNPADVVGGAQIWAVNAGAGTITLSSNVKCTTCGSITITATTVVQNIWGAFLGFGAQKNNNMRANFVPIYAVNKYAISYRSQEFSIALTSPPTTNFPLTGSCPIFCNGTPAITGMPLLQAWGYKNGSFRAYVYENKDNAPHTVGLSGASLTGTVTRVVVGNGAVSGGSNNWSDDNETTVKVAPVIDSISMPTSMVLPAHSYVILRGSNSTPVVATPVINPTTNAFSTPQNVTITDSTSGATIHYTIDGTTPTATSPVYSVALVISITTTVKAIAVKAGSTDSGVATSTITIRPILPSVVFSPVSGTISLSPIPVTLTDATAGVTICYTTNGSTPTANAGTCTGSTTTYTGFFTVTVSGFVNAIASKSGFTNSALGTARYGVGPGSVTWDGAGHIILGGSAIYQ